MAGDSGLMEGARLGGALASMAEPESDSILTVSYSSSAFCICFLNLFFLRFGGRWRLRLSGLRFFGACGDSVPLLAGEAGGFGAAGSVTATSSAAKAAMCQGSSAEPLLLLKESVNGEIWHLFEARATIIASGQ